MQIPVKVLGVAGAMTAAAATTAGVAHAVSGGTSPGDDDGGGQIYPYPYDGSPVDPATDYPPYGGGTSPGDDPISMPVRGHVDPPGWFDDYSFDGSLQGSRLEAHIDPRGWLNTVHVSGRVDGSGYETRIDRQGWGGVTTLHGSRQADGGFSGSVDRPGFWNGATLRVTETARGAALVRDGRFDEPLTPSWDEASWHSEPVGTGGGARTLDFDPPGWSNTTHVTLEGNPPAGVEASIATHLFDSWKTEQERQAQQDADYPDTDYPGSTSPGDSYPDTYPDPSYPGGTSPGDGF